MPLYFRDRWLFLVKEPYLQREVYQFGGTYGPAGYNDDRSVEAQARVTSDHVLLLSYSSPPQIYARDSL